MRLGRKWFASLSAAWLLAPAVHAETPDEFRIYAENDALNWFTEGTDRFYTQGLRIEWFHHEVSEDEDFVPRLSHFRWCELMCGGTDGERLFSSGYAVQQTMYTPENIALSRPQPYDRPWAGILTFSRLARAAYVDRETGTARQDTVEVAAGIVGPPSLSGDTQIWWHDLWGFQRPNGWANQLRTEPVLQARYEAAFRWPVGDGRNVDAITRTSFSFGNALIAAEGSVALRLGWNLAGFQIAPIPIPAPPPAASASAKSESLSGNEVAVAAPDLGARPQSFSTQRRDERAAGVGNWLRSGNVFARLGTKAIAHSLVLDGNTFVENDIRIDREPIVPELAVGFELNLVGDFWLTGQFIHRGSEFTDWRGIEAPEQEFGSITVAMVKDF